MRRTVAITELAALGMAPAAADEALRADVEADYEANLEALFLHFHANPELSHREFEAAKRLAKEIRSLGYEVLAKGPLVRNPGVDRATRRGADLRGPGHARRRPVREVSRSRRTPRGGPDASAEAAPATSGRRRCRRNSRTIERLPALFTRFRRERRETLAEPGKRSRRVRRLMSKMRSA